MYVRSDNGRVWHISEENQLTTFCGLEIGNWHYTSTLDLWDKDGPRLCKKCEEILDTDLYEIVDEIRKENTITDADLFGEVIPVKADKRKNPHSF